MDGRVWAAVALGGAIGAMLRHLVGVAFGRTGFPYATLTVNVIGSLLLGLFLFHQLARDPANVTARAFFAVGVLGAFTTMSTFSLDTLLLYQEGRTAAAAANVALNVTLSLAAVLVGRWIIMGTARTALA